MTKAIIIGMLGQDGPYLKEYLESLGYIVIGTTSNQHRTDEAVYCDVRDIDSLNALFASNRDVLEVYNLAAQSSVYQSFQDPGLTWDINAKGVINILTALKDNNLQHVKFFQAGSSEMFGRSFDTKVTYTLKRGDVNADFHWGSTKHGQIVNYQNEDTKLLPQSPYGISKCAAQQTVKMFRDFYGMRACTGILMNHESPTRGPQFVTRKITKWLGGFSRWLKRNNISAKHLSARSLDSNCDILFASGIQSSYEKLKLGNINVARDWGYAPDFMKAAHLMLQQDAPDDYVVCTGETHQLYEFVKYSFSLLGLDNWRDYINIDHALYRPSEVEYIHGDNTKIRSLGWEPTKRFHSIIEEMVEYDTRL